MEDKFVVHGYKRSLEPVRGTQLALANGRFGVRGELDLVRTTHGVIHAGIYDDAPIFKREIVSLPDIRSTSLYLDGMKYYVKEDVELTRILDLKNGILHALLKDKDTGLRYSSTRIVHRGFKDLFIMIASVSYPGRILLVNTVNSNTLNPLEPSGVYIKHYRILEKGVSDDSTYMTLETLNGKYKIALAALSKPLGEGACKPYIDEDEIGSTCTSEDVLYTARLVVLKSSLHSSDPLGEALSSLRRYASLEVAGLIKQHAENWNKLWSRVDFKLEDPLMDAYLRFHTFHILQLYDEEADQLVIPARGLHGFGYRGHVFWDADIYLLPFFTFFLPDAARKLLAFRGITLEKARENARMNGFEGAQYPWESDEEGNEVTPSEIPLDYKWDRRVEIHTGREEIHITADIAYAVDYYYEATMDDDFMRRYGLKIIFETARYWASRLEYLGGGRYGVRGVIGPDEYHVHVDNSYYTNLLAKHNLLLACKYYSIAAGKEEWWKVISELRVSEDEIERFKRIADSVHVNCDAKGLCEEFEGYFKLKDVILDEKGNFDKLNPAAKGFNTERTRLVKQADVILAQVLMHVLGYEYPGDLAVNYDYYIKRTTHESSLSIPMYATAAAITGKHGDALELFKRALRTDTEDYYGNTRDGFHVAAAGGLWWIILHGFLGVKFKGGKAVIGRERLQGGIQVSSPLISIQ